MYMHDTRDVQQMGIRLAVYKRELSLRTPAAEYTGVDCPALASHTVCLVGIDLLVWSYLSPNQDQFLEAEEKEREKGEIFWLSATGCDMDLKDCV